MSSGKNWASDVPISMPRALDGHGPLVTDNQSLVPMGGFCFTINGLFHDLSDNDLAAYRTGSLPPVMPGARRVDNGPR